MHQKEKTKDTKKYNILNIVKNVSSLFTGIYLYYKNVSKEAMFERSIAERIKLRKERFDEIKRKEQNINNELFKAYFTYYQSPSSMNKKIKRDKKHRNK